MAGNDEAKMKLTQTLLSQLLKESGSTRLDEPRRSETSSYQSSGQGKGGGAPGVHLEIAAIEMLISRYVCLMQTMLGRHGEPCAYLVFCI